jgi:hypothetical protein
VIEKLRTPRRTLLVGAFPNGQSALNLAAARLRQIAGTAYLNIELMRDQQMRGAITASAGRRSAQTKMCEKLWTFPRCKLQATPCVGEVAWANALTTIAAGNALRSMFSSQAVCVRAVHATLPHGPRVPEYPERRHCAKNRVRQARHLWGAPQRSWHRVRVAANRAG